MQIAAFIGSRLSIKCLLSHGFLVNLRYSLHLHGQNKSPMFDLQQKPSPYRKISPKLRYLPENRALAQFLLKCYFSMLISDECFSGCR
jgi:hypothetical protein